MCYIVHTVNLLQKHNAQITLCAVCVSMNRFRLLGQRYVVDAKHVPSCCVMFGWFVSIVCHRNRCSLNYGRACEICTNNDVCSQNIRIYDSWVAVEMLQNQRERDCAVLTRAHSFADADTGTSAQCRIHPSPFAMQWHTSKSRRRRRRTYVWL